MARRRFTVPMNSRAKFLLNQRGVTLVELMIAVAFLSTVALSTALTYTVTMKALVTAKSRGIASRLAQDKFETLQGLSYPNLIVTSQADLNIPPGVDLTNYPPETFNMGAKTFTRSVIISRAYRDSSNNITILSPSAADTGLKRITTLVKYQQGAAPVTNTSTLLVTDPGLIPLNVTLYGVVSDTASNGIANAKVYITQNQNWYAMSSSTGYYQIQMDTSTYTATATRPGYWDNPSASFSPPGGPYSLNFQLTAKAIGGVAGIVTARPPSLLISSVYTGTQGSPTNDFLELYNPTTAPILITDGTSAEIQIKYILPNNSIKNVTFTWGDANPHSIPAQGYYLIATSSPTVNGRPPDGLFSAPTSPFVDLKAGVAIQNSFSMGLDTVGWTNDGTAGPPNGVETTGVIVTGANWGPAGSPSGVLNRKSDPFGMTAGVGNSVSNNNNAQDVLLLASVGAAYPRNSQTATSPVQYGTTAATATMAATDGYSAATTASSTGYYLLNSVTTGTWSLAGYWNAYSSMTAGNIQVNTGAITVLNLLLEHSSRGGGGVSGRVTRSDTLAAVSNIIINSGTASTLTDALGNYVLNLASGTQPVIANDGFSNIGYNSLSTTATVVAGGITTGVNFNLVPSGAVSGKVTTNGTDAYPNIPVHAVSQGLEVATTQSDSFGNYSLFGIPTGAASIVPILDPQSTAANPPSISLSITQGTTLSGNDFIVTTSLGKITGSVTSGGNGISTGVLILASTTTLTSPPLVNNAYRTGSTVLYATTSDSSGQYTVNVVLDSTYTLYGYYTSLSNNNTTATVVKTASSIYVSSTSHVNLAW